jgi:hypothetical protein
MKALKIKFILILCIFCSNVSKANSLLEIFDISLDQTDTQRFLALPVAFYTGITDFAYGGFAVSRNYGQKGLNIFSGGYYSTNDSYGTIVGIYNYAPKVFKDRIYFDVQYNTLKSTEDYMFYDENKNTPSENTQRIDGVSRFQSGIFSATYVLPLNKKDKREKGVENSTNPGNSDYNNLNLNPLKTGRTKIEVSNFYDKVSIDSEVDGIFLGYTTGARVKLEFDNRDFPGSPNLGNRTFIKFSRDWGDHDRAEYTKFEVDSSHYFPLPNFKVTRQQTLAANIYYSNMIDWDENDRPAWFAQSNLGGVRKLRGYQYSRFFGKSALYGSVEYRLTPFSNIFKEIPIIDKIDIPWWQTVLSVEAGEVIDSNSLTEFIENPKYSYGIGLRALIEGIVGRADVAFSKDGTFVRLMVNQTF